MKAPDELKESVLVIQRQLARERPCPRSPPPPWLSRGSHPSTPPSIQTTEEVEKMEPDKPAESTLVIQRQPGLERPRPNRPPLPWLSSGKPSRAPPSLQTAKEVAGRTLDSSRQGLHTVGSEDFATFAALNRARILRSTAELLESTKEEAQEPTKGRTPPRTAGSGSPTTHLSPHCPSSSRINTTDTQELREEKHRTAKNQDRADVTDVARILRCAAKLLKSLEATSKKSREAKVTKAPGEKPIKSKALVEENIVPEALTQASTKSKIFNNAGPEKPIEPKATVEEHIVTKAQNEAPTESKILDTAEPQETVKSKAPTEEHTVPKAPIEAEEAMEA